MLKPLSNAGHTLEPGRTTVPKSDFDCIPGAFQHVDLERTAKAGRVLTRLLGLSVARAETSDGARTGALPGFLGIWVACNAEGQMLAMTR